MVDELERVAWLKLVNATTMRGDCGSYDDPMSAFRQACVDREEALRVLVAHGVDTGLLRDPHGMWRGAGAWSR